MGTVCRYFDFSDEPTVNNLGTLDHLCRQICGDGDARGFDTLLRAAINCLQSLPPSVSRHFRSSASGVCDLSYRATPGERTRKWALLTAMLAEGLDAVLSDPELAPGAAANLSGMPTTRGERIKATYRDFQADLRAHRWKIQGLLSHAKLSAHNLHTLRSPSPHRS